MRVDPAASQLWAWLAVAVVSSVTSAVRGSKAGLSVRLLEVGYDIGQHLAVGLVSFAVALLWSRLSPRPWLRPAVLFALAFAVLWPLLIEDISIFSGKIALFGPMLLWRGALIAVAALAVSASFELSRRFTAAWARALTAAVAAAAAAANELILPHDYPGVHFLLAWGAALMIAGALATRGDSPAPRRSIVIALAALIAVASVATVPSNAVLLELSRSSGSVVAPFLARLRGSARVARWVETSDPWFSSRASAAEVPPSGLSPLPPNGIVVLLTVDCLRADVIEKDEHVQTLPALARLRRESLLLTQTRTTAPATTQAITSLTTSTLYSQLLWTPLDARYPDYVYPHQDPTPRVTELLSRAGVHTASVQGLPGISQKFGLVREVKEEVILPGSRAGYAGVAAQVPIVLELLRNRSAGPLFIFAHFGDPHAPYDRGGGGTVFERYLGEIRLVDEGIGKILEAIDQLGLTPRTAVIVSADHGEAFGEHGTKTHATTLYDELLRVPLLIRLPGASPRTIDEPVSLLDVAPTILDLFGQPAPGRFMGQSLVPLLAGKPSGLQRPIAFESGRAQRGLLFPDGIKVTQQLRGDILEAYDLRRDPGETRNLVDFGGLDRGRVALLERYFTAHRLDRPDYQLPFAR